MGSGTSTVSARGRIGLQTGAASAGFDDVTVATGGSTNPSPSQPAPSPRFNRDSGLQLSRIVSDTPRDRWPANNLVLSAESHDNADSDGEDADGFAAKLTVGSGNVFRHAVSHHNIDDGWDLCTKSDTGAIGAVTVEDSLAYSNFTFETGSSVFRSHTSCRSGSGTNDKVVGNTDSSNQFWTGSNGSRCASYTGALAWSFASDGTLVVTIGGRVVTL